MMDNGYRMGVYLRLGIPIHMVDPSSALRIDQFKSYNDIHMHMSQHSKIFLFLGEGIQIKKKAEQIACESAIKKLNALPCNLSTSVVYILYYFINSHT